MQQGVFVRFFVASPGDVREEREEACRVIQDWNAAHSMSRSALIEPVRVETHSHAVQGGHPQDLINGQLLERCDILLAIFWHRFGTPTAKEDSGTLQEIREFAEQKGAERVLLFFCQRDLPSDVDSKQLEAVRAFKSEMQDKGLYSQYDSVADFARLFRQQLEMALNSILETDEAQIYSRREKEVRFEQESCTLLAAGALAEHSNIMITRTNAGTQIYANRRCYSKGNDGRSEARWEGAIDQLESLELISTRSFERQIFQLTKEGYRQADQLWYVALLRLITKEQDDPLDYVDIEDDLVGQVIFGQTLERSFLAEKIDELHELDVIETVAMDGRIPASRLNDAGRKTLRENGSLEFAEPDVDHD